MECARSWLVRQGSGRLPFSVKLNKFGSLGTTTECSSFWLTGKGCCLFFPKGVRAQEGKQVGYERIVYYVMRLRSIRSVQICNGYLLFCVLHFYSIELTISACV